MKVPIRYGRKSDKRAGTFTMVFARSCSDPVKLGTGMVVPTRSECCEPEHLLNEAEHLWAAERDSEKVAGISAEWGRVCLLKNPNAVVPESLLKAWQAKVKKEGSSYTQLPIADGEEPVFDAETGGALFSWPIDCETNQPLSGFDLLLMTATAPTLNGGQYPTVNQIADAWRTDRQNNVLYFYNNRYYGITTFEDDRIRAVLQGELPKLDSVAEWFLRLNGFFTILNFVVHPIEPNEGAQQRTDADILGVRFPNRREIVGSEVLPDHPAFQASARTLLVIAEVKAGRCRLNGPWTRREDENINHVLHALGCVRPGLLEAVSGSLYQFGRYESGEIEARLLCFGARRSDNLPVSTIQFTWDEIFGFVYDRYQAFWRLKRENQQWPPVGRLLWDMCRNQQRDPYIRQMMTLFNVSAANNDLNSTNQKTHKSGA